jgi:hypothetical protein
MGGLRPIGSEKLQGMDKIRRIMEIARFNEVLPQSINENKSTEYTLPLADGNTYAIVKERQGYIIKLSLNESVTDYNEPMENRKYYPSYSQALKRLNLMAKEYNGLYGNDEGISLFTEQKKKFKLRLPTTNTEEIPTPAPAPELAPAPAPVTPPAPAGDMPPPPEGMGGDMGSDMPPPPSDMGGDMPPPPEGMDDMGGDMPPPPEGMDDMDDMGDEMPPLPDDMEDDMGDESKKEEGTSFKIIQKLTGKLAQKIRKFNDKDEMDGNDVKYIINSILSAIDVDVLDDDDLEEIISRLEGDYDDEDKDEEDDDNEDEDVSIEEPSDMGDDELPPPPPEGGEMTEYDTPTIGDAINRLATTTMAHGLSKMREMEEYPKHGARTNQRNYNHFEHGTFGESKVDKIISKYFNITNEDVIINESKEIKRKENIEKLREKNIKGIKRLSENIKQERMSLKFIEINPTSRLAGLSNKGNLVFVDGLTERKITTDGKVL